MTAICQGSIGKFEHLLQFKGEIADLIGRSTQKVMRMKRFFSLMHQCFNAESLYSLSFPSSMQHTHIVAFVQNRLPMFTENILTDRMISLYLVYEMMFLWNTYSNIRPNHLEIIIESIYFW